MAAVNPPIPPGEPKETAVKLMEGKSKEQQPRVNCAETVCEGKTEEQASSAEADVKFCDEEQPRVSSAASCSTTTSSSSRSEPTRRLSMRRPDGSSAEAGPADLESLEKVLKRESVVVDSLEVAHLTLPSTPLKDGLCNDDVKLNLELASEKLSKLPPQD